MNNYPTPYEKVQGGYTLPFELFPFQVETVNELALYEKAGYWLDPGLGKTSVATVSALYKLLEGEAEQVIVLAPPIVLDTWRRWLDKLPEVSYLIYRGTPAERKQMRLDADFIVVGYQIFKRDYNRFVKEVGHRKLIVLADEAHAVKNTSSDNYRKVNQFASEQHLILMSGTPVTSPRDVYAYTKLICPSLYRSLGAFDNIHVADRDFFGKVTAWRHLDLLSENLLVQSKRILKQDVLTDLPEVTYTPLYYELEREHLKLYKTLAEQQVLLLEGGGKIDATSSTALYNKLQQIVCNWAHFSGDETRISNAMKLIDLVREEIGESKLIVFGQYRMTNRNVLEYLKPQGAVASYGGQTPKQNSLAIERFINDPKVKYIVMQPQSGGVGVDGLQEVCSDALYLEEPVVPRDFHQSVSRIHRQGQKGNVNVRIGIAEKTIQVRLHENLMQKDQMVNRIAGGFEDLRDAIYGQQ